MSRLRLTHRRTRWLGKVGMTGPAFDWDTIDFIVVHWPGHNGVPAGGQAVADLLRRNHESSVANKGYSHYYNVMVDRSGDTWEVRGDTFRNAANAPAGFNRVSFSIQVMTNLDGATTAAQDAALSDLIGQVKAIRPNALVLPHQDGVSWFAAATRTQCCGPIAPRVRDGEFAQKPAEPAPEPPAPAPIPPEEDDDMKVFLFRPESNQYQYTVSDGISARRVRSAQVDELQELISGQTGPVYVDPSTNERILDPRAWTWPTVSDDMARLLGVETIESLNQ